jgi:hypothetical protein
VPEELGGIHLVPTVVKVLLALMTFTYVSLCASVVGLMPTYVHLIAMAASASANADADRVEEGGVDTHGVQGGGEEGGEGAAMGHALITLFSVSAAICCLVSIPCAVRVSTAFMLRAHLALILLALFVFNLFLYLPGLTLSYVPLCAGTLLLGCGVSAIAPLTLTVVNEYGYTM